MSEPTESRSAFPAIGLAACAALLVFALRTALVFHAGSPVPFHDQWTAEGEHLLVHDARHTLTWHNFTVPNGDHPNVATRMIAFALFRLTGRWDMLAEMIVNNAIIAAAFGVLGWHFLRTHGSRLAGAGVLTAAAWLGSPLFYGNALWGFQSSIELLVLAGIVQLSATYALRSFDAAWFCAHAAAVIGAVSFGTGAVAPALCLIVIYRRFRRREVTAPAFLASAALNVVIVAGSAAFLLRGPSAHQAHVPWADVIHTTWHALSWPAMQPAWFAALLWWPSLAWAASAVFRRTSGSVVAAALAVWTLGQVAGIAWARSAPTPALAPRYYDLFAVGVLANAILAVDLVKGIRDDLPRRLATLALVGWFAGVGVKAAQFTRSHWIHDLPAMRSIAAGQVDLVRRYSSGGGVAVLSSVAFPVRPHPDVAKLDELLREPAIRRALPASLTDAAAENPATLSERRWPDHGPRRSTWFVAAIAAALLAAIAGLIPLALHPKS